MRSGITGMIVGGLVLICLLSLAVTAFINLHKFNAAYENVVNDRFYFAMGQARNLLEAEMRLGQPLSQLQAAQPVLDDLQAIDPHIVSVEIFDQKGQTLYSTDNSFLMDFVPKAWETAWLQTPGKRWSVDTQLTTALGLGLRNAFDEPVGSIALLYDVALQETAFLSIQNKLQTYALWIALGALVVLGVAVVVLTRPLKSFLQYLQQDLVSEQDTPSCQNAQVEAFRQSYDEAQKLLQTTQQELEALDEGRKTL